MLQAIFLHSCNQRCCCFHLTSCYLFICLCIVLCNAYLLTTTILFNPILPQSRHDALGDWKDVLPTSCKLKDRANKVVNSEFASSKLVPTDEVSLKEESDDFNRAVIDAVGNNVVQAVMNNFFREEARTIDQYIKSLR